MLLLGFGGALVAATPNALPPKESLDYTIEWRLVTAGKAHLNWSATAHDADPGWEADLQLESVGLVSKLFKVNNSYISNLESDLCSSGSYLKAEEGKRRKETSVTFDHQNHKAEYLEKDLEKGTVVNTHEIEIPARLDPGHGVRPSCCPTLLRAPVPCYPCC